MRRSVEAFRRRGKPAPLSKTPAELTDRKANGKMIIKREKKKRFRF
jgi:hypothetical protein